MEDTGNKLLQEIKELSETSGDIQSVTVVNGKVTALSYDNGKVTCKYHSSSEDSESGEDVEEGYTVSTND